MPDADLLVRNIGELVTIAGPDAPRVGEQMQQLGIINQAAIAIQNGKIMALGPEREIVPCWQAAHSIDAGGALVTPGLVDPHTHPVFAASREQEFAMRVSGASYLEIAKAGGGIRNSARKLQHADKLTLKREVCRRLDRFLRLGTTTIEAKSGYGLSTASELKSLEILSELTAEHPLDIVSTFLGAHEIPDEYQHDREGYIRLLIDEMIPEVARRKLADYCDIFCEEHVFTIEESRRILQAARQAGLKLKLHADELTALGGAELAAELQAVSADHLVAVSDAGIARMSANGVIAVLLPATTFYLASSQYAPARKMIDAGVAVALSTDFNPGSSMTQSLPLVLTLACLYLKMLPCEALVAVTINSACAIGMAEKVGSLQIGKQADLVIWQADNYRYLPYHFGDNLAAIVIKSGNVVSDNRS